jgi:ATP-dependent DNA helicase RecG
VSHLRDALSKGRQAYWVCPLVEESEVYDAVAAEERFAHLRAELGEGKVGLVHGRMTPTEKAEVMEAFQSGRVQVLVATTVIEVGVDVPNASIMVIEQADLFGLSQLHQLRGGWGAGGGIDLPAALPLAPGRDGEAAADGPARDRGRVPHRRGGPGDSRRGGPDRHGAIGPAAVPNRRSGTQTPLMALAQSGARALLAPRSGP